MRSVPSFLFTAALAALAGGAAGCKRDDAARAEPRREPAPRVLFGVTEGVTDPSSAARSPLGDTPIVELDVPGFHPAKVALPLGAREGERKPVIVATHGAWDGPHYYCDFWQKTAGDRAFVVCPRGAMASPKGTPVERAAFFYRDHRQLGDEVTAALDALEGRYAAHVDLERPIYTGFSQGAIQGAVMLPAHPAKFASAILVEGGFGGYREWGPGTAKAWVERGGERVALLCGRPSCADKAEDVKRWIEGAGGEARVWHVEGAGHTHGGPMEPAVREAFAWVTERDRRF